VFLVVAARIAADGILVGNTIVHRVELMSDELKHLDLKLKSTLGLNWSNQEFGLTLVSGGILVGIIAPPPTFLCIVS
jgi:hypothetical protein